MKDRKIQDNSSRSEFSNASKKLRRTKHKKKTNLPNDGICLSSLYDREKHFEELENYKDLNSLNNNEAKRYRNFNNLVMLKANSKECNIHPISSDVCSSISEDIDVSEEIHDRCIHDSIISGLITNDDTKEERVQTMNTMDEEIANEECNEEDVIDENVTCLL